MGFGRGLSQESLGDWAVPGGVTGELPPWLFWTLLALVGLIIWALLVHHRPLAPCKYCDNGRDWDGEHEHYGMRCTGWGIPFTALGSCHGAGRKLRWEIRILRFVGVGSGFEDPVRRARER